MTKHKTETMPMHYYDYLCDECKKRVSKAIVLDAKKNRSPFLANREWFDNLIKSQTNPAVALGKIKSKRKAIAARKNGKLGGRPKKNG